MQEQDKDVKYSVNQQSDSYSELLSWQTAIQYADSQFYRQLNNQECVVECISQQAYNDSGRDFEIEDNSYNCLDTFSRKYLAFQFFYSEVKNFTVV